MSVRSENKKSHKQSCKCHFFNSHHRVKLLCYEFEKYSYRVAI
jgi:hypothetical protein